MDYFVLNRIYFLILPVHSPLKHWNFYQKLVYFLWRLLWAICLISAPILMTLDIIYREKIETIEDVSTNIMYIVLFINVNIRSVIIFKMNKTFEEFMEDLNNKIVFKSPLVENGRTMAGTKTFATRLATWWVVETFIATVYMDMDALVSKGRNLPIPLWLFFDWRKDEIYWIVFLIASISNIMMSTTFASTDVYHTSCMIYMADQYLILEESINNIFKNAFLKHGCFKEEIEQFLHYEDTNEKRLIKKKLQTKFDAILSSDCFKENLMKNMLTCIEHHQRLFSLVEKYESFMAPMLLIEYQGIFGYFIFMLFVLVTTTSRAVYIGVCQYLTGATAQIFMICYFAEVLTRNSMTVRTALYNIPWYLCDKKFMEIFKIMQMRTVKIIEIKAGRVLPLTLESFVEFMKRAFSFFTVLRQVY